MRPFTFLVWTPPGSFTCSTRLRPMDPQPLRGGDYGAPRGVANATEFVAHIFPVPAGRTFREAQIRLRQNAVFHPLIPGLRGDAEFAGAGRSIDEFRHSVAWAQIVLVRSRATNRQRKPSSGVLVTSVTVKMPGTYPFRVAVICGPFVFLADGAS